MIFHTNGYIFENILSKESSKYVVEHNIKYILFVMFNGSNAVSYFFVLSGFVLSYKYLKSNSIPDFKSFVIQRIFRIYPLFIVIVTATYLYANGIPNKRNYLKEILILPNFHTFIPPGWTITIELAISLFIPIIIIVLVTNFKWGKNLLLISLFTTIIFSNFLPHFILGALICYLFINNRIEEKYHRIGFLICAVLIYSSITILSKFPTAVNFLNNVQVFAGLEPSFLDTILPGFASAFFIIYILKSQTLQNILNWKPFIYLGKISYGVYLIHYFIIHYIVNDKIILYLSFNNILSTFIIINLIVLILTLLSSAFLYHIVELPFINFGKRILKSNMGHKTTSLK